MGNGIKMPFHMCHVTSSFKYLHNLHGKFNFRFFILKGAVEQLLRHINYVEFVELLEHFMEVEAVES